MNKFVLLGAAVLGLFLTTSVVEAQTLSVAAAPDTAALAPANSVEQVLLAGKTWKGRMDTSRPGCGSCGSGTMELIFSKEGSQLNVRISFTRDGMQSNVKYAEVKVDAHSTPYWHTGFNYECPSVSRMQLNCVRDQNGIKQPFTVGAQ